MTSVNEANDDLIDDITINSIEIGIKILQDAALIVVEELTFFGGAYKLVEN